MNQKLYDNTTFIVIFIFQCFSLKFFLINGIHLTLDMGAYLLAIHLRLFQAIYVKTDIEKGNSGLLFFVNI